MENTITKEQAVGMVRAAGFESGVSFEDEQIVLASSLKTIPGTFGHPVYTVMFHKQTGWLTSGGAARKLEQA